MEKPNWWPKNPYPEAIFPMPREKYSEVVPNPKTRTALSGMLGREFWDIASKSIWDALNEYIENIEVGTCPNCGHKITQVLKEKETPK